MGNIFSGSEIVELGVQIEKNGRDFYEALSRRSREKNVGDLFIYLKGEEEKHIVVFQKILESTQKYKSSESYEGEYTAYMNALASEYVFTKKDKGKEIANSVKTDKEAVELGIGFEKDSILFYEGMKKVVPDYDMQVVDKLIRQEQEHLRQLSDLKTKL